MRRVYICKQALSSLLRSAARRPKLGSAAGARSSGGRLPLPGPGVFRQVKLPGRRGGSPGLCRFSAELMISGEPSWEPTSAGAGRCLASSGDCRCRSARRRATVAVVWPGSGLPPKQQAAGSSPARGAIPARGRNFSLSSSATRSLPGEQSLIRKRCGSRRAAQRGSAWLEDAQSGTGGGRAAEPAREDARLAADADRNDEAVGN